MAEFRAVVNQTSTCLFNSLKFTEGTVRQTVQETITGIELAGDEYMNECFCMVMAEKFSDVTDVVEVGKCRGRNFAYVSVHGYVLIKPRPQISHNVS